MFKYITIEIMVLYTFINIHINADLTLITCANNMNHNVNH